jgi:ComF family protein
MAIRFQRWLTSLAEALFPGKCVGCGHLFHQSMAGWSDAADFTAALAPYFCPHCRRQWTALASPLCRRCGMVFKSREGEDHLCGRCLDRPGAFAKARAAGVYDQSLRCAIQALKFNSMVQLADPLGRQLFNTFRQYWSIGDIDLIAPVPLHQQRFRRRGFNQAYLLIAGWRLSGETVIVRDLLVRHRATTPQAGLDRRQRRSNIKNAFAVRHPGQSTGRRVLLVDDVLTTGATADACARALLRDGAARVDVLTLARAL